MHSPGNAKIAGLDKDLGMQGYDYNMILTSFYITFILSEIPALLLCKRIGPRLFLPLCTVLFGICSVTTGFVTNTLQACMVRALLGIFEAGMMPGIAYALSRWYTRAELAFRLSLYIVTAPIAGAFGGLLASAILTLPHFGTLTSWRMIFAIEGLLTILAGLLAFVLLTDSPSTASWLTPSEKSLSAHRLLRERPTGPAHLLDAPTPSKYLRGSLLNPLTVSVALVFLLDAVTVQALAFFLPTVVRSLFPPSTPQTTLQLLTVPPYLFGASATVLLSLLSWRIDHRQGLFLIPAALVITGYGMFVGSRDAATRYAAAFLASGAFALGPLTNAQVCANCVSDTAKNAGLAVNGMMAAVGGLVGTWAFLPWDAPGYAVGNGLNLGTGAGIFVVSSGVWWWMGWDNGRREREEAEGRRGEWLEGLSEGEREGLEWRHPGFRWKP